MVRKYEGWGKPIAYTMLVLFFISIFYLIKNPSPSNYETTFERDSHGRKLIHAATWNVAAINNNPFEYWITAEDSKKNLKNSSSSNVPGYNQLLSTVSNYIKNTNENDDILLDQIFTSQMYDELETLFKEKTNWVGINETRTLWENDYSKRKFISNYIKDNVVGKKRLISMPDRVTNTISSVNPTSPNIMRPTVINCYSGTKLESIKEWWEEWKKFFFYTPVEVKNKKTGEFETRYVYELINKIDNVKYPTLSAEESTISLPLQTLALALFDSSLVYMMNGINSKLPTGNWQDIRSTICDKLNLHKTDKLIEILETSYNREDIIFLQETSSVFPSYIAKTNLSQLFNVITTTYMDTDRDQNSIILLKKGLFKNDIKDVTKEFYQFMEAHMEKANKKMPIVKGDLIVVVVTDAYDDSKYLLASFHGDTNGLATIPVVNAMHKFSISSYPNCKLLFGMDANTYANPESDQQGVVDFARYYVSLHMNSCYGPTPDPNNFTTFHARTYLQPQLNKAISLEEKDIKGDKNPKDFILFFDSDYKVVRTGKDNTGNRQYIEGMVFPTLSFPSDHGITYTTLHEKIM